MTGGQATEYVIEAGWALVDRDGQQELLREASILVSGDSIVDVRSGWGESTGEVVDARTLLVLPGFISGHTHTSQSNVARGLIEGGRFMRRPVELVEELDDDELDALTAFNIAEMLRSGCTTIIEMSGTFKQASSFVRVARAWGVRAYVSIMLPTSQRVWDIWYREGDGDSALFDSVPETLREIELAHAFLGELNASEDLLTAQMGAHAADTHTPETLAAIQRAADDLGNGMHIHVAQRIREVESVRRMWGMTPVAWLESLGVFSRPVIAAHLTQMDPIHDLPILLEHGVTHAHCPCMASLLHQSSQPLAESLAAGLNVAIGIDQLSNDYVENIKLATLNGQLRTTILEPTATAPMERPQIIDTVRAATLGGARALRRDDLGLIAAGAKADLCTIDISGLLTGLGALPPDPLHHLLYSNGLAVRDVITDGRFMVRDGELVVAPQGEVVAAGGAVMEGIWKQLADEDWYDAPPPPNTRR